MTTIDKNKRRRRKKAVLLFDPCNDDDNDAGKKSLAIIFRIFSVDFCHGFLACFTETRRTKSNMPNTISNIEALPKVMNRNGAYSPLTPCLTK